MTILEHLSNILVLFVSSMLLIMATFFVAKYFFNEIQKEDEDSDELNHLP